MLTPHASIRDIHHDSRLMDKDFKGWHSKKEKIENQNETISFRERDIWWCHLGLNLGHEQDGKGEEFSRPILIIRKFNEFLFWGVPLSKVLKKNPYYIPCKSSDGKVRSAMISQLRLFSAKRITDKLSFAEKDSFEEIKKDIKQLF